MLHQDRSRWNGGSLQLPELRAARLPPTLVTIPPMIADFAHKKVIVMGLGHFGGGIGVTRWLVKAGAEVTVTDSAESAALAGSVAQLEDLDIRWRLGGHDESDLNGCDLLVVSPAVPKERSPFVQEAVRRGIPISSEMNLFIERCPARRIVGITGSAGKSTTTAMLGSILAAAAAAGVLPRVWIGGNIGQSLLGELAVMRPEDVVVLELSSFQLEDLGSLRWSPPYAVITNVKPNHLDRHGTLEAYLQAKLNIVRYQDSDGRVFVHADENDLAESVRAAGAGERLQRYAFDTRFAGDLQVPGGHNRVNAAAAIVVARALDVPDECIARGLRAFRGLPHRLEFVGEHGGVRYYNDSKATTPESACIALHAFEEPVVLLVGGKGKGAPFDVLTRDLAARAKAVVCYGYEGERLHGEVSGYCQELGRRIPVEQAGSFAEAVEAGRRLAVPGDVVVLSPACVSYDMFGNYEERGETFRKIVQAFSQA